MHVLGRLFLEEVEVDTYKPKGSHISNASNLSRMEMHY